MVRQSRWSFITQAGAEIGVASTKAFTTQLVALFLLAVTLGRLRGHVDEQQEASYRSQLSGPLHGAAKRARARTADHRVGA